MRLGKAYRSRLSAFAIGACLCLSRRGVSDTHVWSGMIDGSWSNPGNWSSGGAPSQAEGAAALVFPPLAFTYLTTNDIANLTISGIEIQQHGYTLYGNPLVLSGGISMDTPYSSAVGIFFIMYTTATAHVINVAEPASLLTIGGAIFGDGGLEKTGPGELDLSGPNTYAGLTNVASGILTAEHETALGSIYAGTVVHDGATLSLSPPSAAGFYENVTLEGSGVNGEGALRFTTDWSVLQASISVVTPTTTVNVTGAARVTIEGAIQGPGGLKKVGSGSLSLAGGPNTFAGNTVISGGLTLMYVQSPPAVPHDLSVLDGTLSLTGGPPQLSPTTNVTIGTGVSSGSLGFGGNNTSTVGSMAFIAGGVQIGSGTTLVLTGDVTASAFALGNYISGGGMLQLEAAPHVFSVSAGGSLNISCTISDSGSGLQKNGPGALGLSGASSYSGPTVIADGSVIVNGSLPFSDVIVNGGVLGGLGSVRSITANASGTVALGQGLTYLRAGAFVALNAGSTFSTVPTAIGYSQLKVTGTVSLGGTLSLAPPLGYIYQSVLIENDGSDPISGTFAGLPEGAAFVVGSTEFRISYRGTDESTGNDVVVTTQTPSVWTDAPGGAFACPSAHLVAHPGAGTWTYSAYQWYRNGQLLNGATASTYDAVQGGYYTVTVTDSLGATSPQSGSLSVIADQTAPTVSAPPAVTVIQATCS